MLALATLSFRLAAEVPTFSVAYRAASERPTLAQLEATSPRREGAAEEAAPETRTRPTWLATAAGVGLESSAAPGPTYTASGSVELGSSSLGALSPSLRLTALYGRAANATTPLGDASFQLAIARLHACALRFAARGSEVRLCGVLDAGALFAAGLGSQSEHSRTMPWLGAGGGALGGLQLSPRLGLDVAIGARLLIVRDGFGFRPDTELHRPSMVAADFRLGLTYRLW